MDAYERLCDQYTSMLYDLGEIDEWTMKTNLLISKLTEEE